MRPHIIFISALDSGPITPGGTGVETGGEKAMTEYVDFRSLTIGEINGIDRKAAIAAIRDAISQEVESDTWRDLIDNAPSHKSSYAYIDDIEVPFRANIPFDWVADATGDEAIRDTLRLEVASSLSVGLAEHIWDRLVEGADDWAWRNVA